MVLFLIGAGVVAIAAAASVGGFLLVSKYVPERWLVADSDAASALYSTIGMGYAILIAIASIAVWEARAGADDAIDQEVAALSEISWTTRAMPPADRNDIQRLIRSYVTEVIDTEWTTMAVEHSADPKADSLFSSLRDRITRIQPTGDRNQAVYEQVVARLAQAADARRARVAAADTGMPELLWPVLAITSLVTITFLYLFGLERTFPNGVMMATVTGIVALVLFVIFQIEYPFSRGMALDSESFRSVFSQLTA